ncbi:phosphotransferase family protein [Patulibacter minatonensis]|uniref:phosphotransferase family protein n=1 Tax=Patulibacter minatonensis TaxID=298163 RepID=UPI001B7FB56A|nr:phosphotransferase family protein [Patulibacter minatonensis]
MSASPTNTDVDQEALAQWLIARGLLDGAIEDLHRIGDGHSNITLLVGDGTRRVVVRRPPPPPLPPGAHDVLREARVLQALEDTGVPVAKVLGVDDVPEVADVPMYVMEHVGGVVLTDDTPEPYANPKTRKHVADGLIDGLAALHAVDWRAQGLEGYGKADGYLERQLRRLGKLIDGGVQPDGLEELGNELRETMPESGPSTIVHGDYRIGNLMVRPDEEQPVAAILDWELATIGDPLADVGYLVGTWAFPGAPVHPLTRLCMVTTEDGWPSPDELAARYAEKTGRDVSQLPWYGAFALWRLAVLFEYGRRRYETGDGDPYYADPSMVREFTDAGRAALSGRTAG